MRTPPNKPAMMVAWALTAALVTSAAWTLGVTAHALPTVFLTAWVLLLNGHVSVLWAHDEANQNLENTVACIYQRLKEMERKDG